MQFLRPKCRTLQLASKDRPLWLKTVHFTGTIRFRETVHVRGTDRFGPLAFPSWIKWKWFLRTVTSWNELGKMLISAELFKKDTWKLEVRQFDRQWLIKYLLGTGLKTIKFQSIEQCQHKIVTKLQCVYIVCWRLKTDEIILLNK